MALVSPGVEVTIIDESQYIPAATNSVPYILLATAQNKTSPTGVGVAPGTLAVNANKVYLMTSQRDLAATFGNPFFYKTTAGTPINGYELNEYGLLAAYSALGVSNRCYVQRVDIDLTELTASLTRPMGAPASGTWWLDTTNTQWGLFQWNITTGQFTNIDPMVITSSNDLDPGYTTPLQSIGNIGDYAVVSVQSTTTLNPVYYKRGGPTSSQTSSTYLSGLYNTWAFVGSTEWHTAWPTISGTLAVSGSLTAGDTIVVNGSTVAVPASPNNTLAGLSGAINDATNAYGVYSAYIGNKLYIYADETAHNGTITTTGATGTGSVATLTFADQGSAPYAVGSQITVTTIGGGYSGTWIVTACTSTSVSYANTATSTQVGGGTITAYGYVTIANGNNTHVLTTTGITAGVYSIPDLFHGYSYQAPRWNSSGTTPMPTGSVWQKQNNVNLGMNIAIKKYNATLGTFVQQACPVFSSEGQALYALDPTGGGKNIPAGSTYCHTDVYNPLSSVVGIDNTATAEILERAIIGATVVTGISTTPGPWVSGNSMRISYSQAGTTAFTSVVMTLAGTTIDDFLTAVSAAGLPSFVTCSVNSSGAIVFTHTQGGDILFLPYNGNVAQYTAITSAAGFYEYTNSGGTPFVRALYANTDNGLVLSNWVDQPQFTYTASTGAPDQDPADGRLWYYSAADQADIMIQDNGQWMGYQNVSNDVRGYDLTMTNASGPIISATVPTTQTDVAGSPLQYGDLWIDTSDLENYPVLNRWQVVDGVDQWVPISNSDQTTENGILFADARWATNGDTDPIGDAIPSITSLLTSDYLDPDAPNPSLYPQGMLLWNSRRSGFNVKSFQVNYFNAATYPDFTGNVTNAWVTVSGNKADGSPYMGRQAQRALIVAALKSGIDTSTGIREEQRQFNLLACPQYPELMPNMIALNNERNDTAFVIGDTPLRLDPQDILTWTSNNNGLGLSTGDGLVAASTYMGVFYPSCQTTDLSGSPVVQPPSHMMIRTIIRNDEVAFPWLAPAGTRRGVVDNAVQIGYVNAMTGEFQPLGVNQGLRDVLYENAVNPITFIPGVGITNFGNKTVTSVASAMDRINVARLVAFIRGRLETIGKQYLFEPNDQITRNQIKNSIDGLMQDLVAKRGLYDYLVVCDLTNNTPARIDRNELYVDIAIEPVKAVEFIYIPVRIKNTGAIAAGG